MPLRRDLLASCAVLLYRPSIGHDDDDDDESPSKRISRMKGLIETKELIAWEGLGAKLYREHEVETTRFDDILCLARTFRKILEDAL